MPTHAATRPFGLPQEIRHARAQANQARHVGPRAVPRAVASTFLSGARKGTLHRRRRAPHIPVARQRIVGVQKTLPLLDLNVLEQARVQLLHHTGVLRVVDEVDVFTRPVEVLARVASMIIQLPPEYLTNEHTAEEVA
jgi:hypothetical protein